jgi:CRISPR-associated helicase Cas3/CRISPR-associated endonuclease Cas3-HD
MGGYYAHTLKNSDGDISPESDWQLLSDHLRNVSDSAAAFARPFGMEKEARIAGLLHDLGKYAQRFQSRLHDPNIHGINHWAAGTVHSLNALRCGLASYAIDGHHTGLPSAGDLAQTRERAKNTEHWRDHTNCCETISELIARFSSDGLSLPVATTKPPPDNFANALRTRMLFSCLVDADFLDTERHFEPEIARCRNVPILLPGRALEILLAHLNAKPADGAVNQLRRQILSDCLGAAQEARGLFTLTAPTGSGKTLASLAFALKQAMKHNKRRVIVVIPYTSIIEQNAQVYRGLFESEFGPDYVLEHHSAVAPRERADDKARDAEEDRLRRARLAAENWSSPLVVTTNVQFFESLFAHKPSDCRKLHNIADSVVIFDEVQTLPSQLVPSLLSAVRLLVRDYGVTALFMTATQPAFASINAALPYGWEPVEISANPDALAETMRRTRISLPKQDERISWPELAAKLGEHSQALCVVNTTKDARALFRLLPTNGSFHLSARMCPAHRKAKLVEIRRRLEPKINLPCRLVSTQLIEAGVDVDFPVAYRAFGPLDSIIQTAGRCNREGRNPEPQPVIVFRPVDGGTPRGAYKTATAKTEDFLARNPDAPLHQPDFYRRYFAELYKLVGPDQAEEDSVFKLSAAFDFPAADAECRLVGENTHSVLVKWQDGMELAEKLGREKHLTADECRSAQRFSVNLYESEFQKALAHGWVYQPAVGWDFFVWNSHYDDNLGACHPESADFQQ